MLKKLFIFLFAIFVATDSFATTDIASNAESSTCNDTVLGTTEGDVNFDAKWQANNIQLRWYNQGELLSVQTAAQTCNYDGALTIPSTEPERTGYTFAGWTVIPGLPAGYTELDYITFEGTQYIDTGLAINNNTRVLFDVKRSTSSAQSNYPWLGGVRDYVDNTGINKKTLEFSKSDFTRLYLQYATSGEITLTVPNTTQRHTYDFDKNKLYVDGNLIYTATQETFVGNATFLIGTVYSQGSVSTNSMFYGDVYGFKLWQDGTNLSMNLIPAKRNSDNVVGMYDRVSGQFFTNQGTGEFIAGPAVTQ